MTAFMIRYHFLSLNLILFLKKLSFSYSNIVVLYKSLENTKKQKEKLILIPAIYFGIFNLFGRIFFSVAMIIYDIQNGIYLFGENICFKILQFFFLEILKIQKNIKVSASVNIAEQMFRETPTSAEITQGFKQMEDQRTSTLNRAETPWKATQLGQRQSQEKTLPCWWARLKGGEKK